MKSAHLGEFRVIDAKFSSHELLSSCKEAFREGAPQEASQIISSAGDSPDGRPEEGEDLFSVMRRRSKAEAAAAEAAAETEAAAAAKKFQPPKRLGTQRHYRG